MTSANHGSGLQLRSLVKSEGVLELSLERVETPAPGEGEVVVQVLGRFRLRRHDHLSGGRHRS